MNAQHKQRVTALTLALAGAAVAVVASASTASALPPPGVGGGGGGTGGGTSTGCPAQNTQREQVTRTLDEHNKTNTDVFTVGHCEKIVLSASGYVSDGWWFHGFDGPEGWVGNAAGNDYPKPGDNTGAVIGRWAGSSSYLHVGQGVTLVNTGASRAFYLFRNDNVPGNGSGSFQVVATRYSA